MMNREEFQKRSLAIRPQLVQKAKQWTKQEEEAEDLVQEVLLKLWISRTQWEQHPNFEALAFKVLKNKNIDRFRSKKHDVARMDECEIVSVGKDPLEQIEANDNTKLLIQIIDQLPDLQRMIIRLKDIEGYEINDIATLTHASPDAIRMNLSRARKKVKELFIKNNT
jgi:RNA polymerase sigma-70 factor (ECF subfamily)